MALPFIPNSVVLIGADIITSILQSPPQWGIFLNGQPAIRPDSTIEFDFRQDFPVSDYRVEPNSFMNYNKVQLPADLRVKVTCGGNTAKRQAFLANVDAVMNTTSLYDVITPEQVFRSYNFTHRDLRRTSRAGLGLLTVELWLTQIIQGQSSTFSSTKSPVVTAPVGAGAVQPITVPVSSLGIGHA